ncbi:DNA cytosine methyltransferase [Actibacterium sp. 188UL27-1]|uniref:DNA cytosine methyltransferase n=1 Tax=Actibacterium sp. 188UL27-1 TaxID=2786961 RepID=UPI0019571AB1|nr:DNA cytosine methyltransferase [Actibacterium sp. 188UL27-1]MBM7070348.1 DNA cytosine methyltransferase [Actibacterium sp. 188UL27-1]
MNTFYEFFAGGGMARAGLGQGWKCVFANDFDRKKGVTYQKNWGEGEMVVDDIRNISLDDLPGRADLVWGSFPCQDLSLAGGGAGLKGDRSGTFWPFIAQIEELKKAGRAPTVIALENVAGTLTSHKGADFTAICEALDNLGYRYGAFIADASHFVPQSRPRLFIIAIAKGVEAVKTGTGPMAPWHTAALKKAHSQLPDHLKASWLWWQMPKPSKRQMRFADVIEAKPASVKWHTAAETRALLSMMSDVNLAKVETAKVAGVVMVGGVYKRTRYHYGIKVQRAEVRFDDVAGCLRTPAGGSSRQLILVVDGERIRSRLISTRETARLMGLPDTYELPQAYNEAYHLTGDGVAVPVVRYIAKHILEPVVKSADASRPPEKAPVAKVK